MRPALTLYDHALRALGWLAFGGIFACALHDASLAFDSWYYHLPFAGRLAGIIPEASFVFHPANQARFDGFALLAELLQGLLWRLTGRAESANLVAFASVPLVAWFMRSRWRVPFPVTMLGLFAIPLVQAHATSCYVDLPGNAAASVLVLLIVDAYSSDDATPLGDVVLALLMGTVAANTKPLLQPVVGLALGALFLRLVQKRARHLAVVMVLAAPFVLFTPLKNALVHGNPFFPIGTRLLGLDLRGPEEPYASAPAWLEHAPRPARFAVSLLEIGIRPLDDPHRWTVDQWMPDESGGNRIGGFFHVYVVASVLAFVARVVRGGSRLERVSAIVFAMFTCLIAWMPQSHELRYYMSWMIVLVCLNLGLASRLTPRRGAPGLRSLGALSALSFMIVVGSTRAAYATPSGITVRELVDSRVNPTLLATVKDGERVCVRREPFNLLWAPAFHPGKRYTVVEAESADDCGGVPEVLSR